MFRQLLREISQLLAYEVTRELPMTDRRIETPMQEMDAPVLAGRKLALVSILRAGNGLLDGMLELIPSARVGFVGLYRDEETLKPVQYYFKVPDSLDERLVIAVDPMLATGNSSAAAIDLLKQAGATEYPLPVPAGRARRRRPDERRASRCAHRHRRAGRAPEREGIYPSGTRGCGRQNVWHKISY